MTSPGWLADTATLGAGLIVLAIGGEFLVRGASRLARILGVTPLVVGLTVVAFGTSAPEAAVTVYAGVQGVGTLAVGNVVGSNIANILLILGLAAAFSPMTVSRPLLRVDGPIMILTAVAFMAAAWTRGQIDPWVGSVFVGGLIAYTTMTYFYARLYPPPLDTLVELPRGMARRWWYNGTLVAVGVSGLVVGARLIVNGATGLAQSLGISDHVIGLTIVAVGTSLPELATTVVAARHRQPDIAVGNIVGSNIFNILFATGLAAAIRPLLIPREILHFDGPVMLGISALFLVMAYRSRRVGRAEGIGLLALYIGYLVWTGLHAKPPATA